MKNTKIKQTLFLSLLSSVLLLCTQFVVYNIRIPLNGDETLIVKRISNSKILTDGIFKFDADNIEHDTTCCFINTSLDQELIEVKEQISTDRKAKRTIGTLPITDRKKLYEYLKHLKDANYRYIILDISLDKGIDHEYNDSLVDLISKMDRICIVKSKDKDLLDPKLENKSGFVSYSKTPDVSDFVKFELYHNENGKIEYSLPFKAYCEITGASITPYGFFAIEKGEDRELINRCVYPIFDKKFTPKSKSANKSANYKNSILNHEIYHNLGILFKDLETNDKRIKTISENRIVVIGNFSELEKSDRHNTYVGEQPGAYILYSILQNLLNNRHKALHLWLVLLIVLLYFLISFCIIQRVSIFVPEKIMKHEMLFDILGFTTFGFLFLSIAIILYLSYQITFLAWIPTLWFTLLSKFSKLYHQK